MPHCVPPAVTYTSEARVHGPGNLGQTSGLCNPAAPHGPPQVGPWWVWRRADPLAPAHGSSAEGRAALGTAAWTPRQTWCRLPGSEHRDWEPHVSAGGRSLPGVVQPLTERQDLVVCVPVGTRGAHALKRRGGLAPPSPMHTTPEAPQSHPETRSSL